MAAEYEIVERLRGCQSEEDDRAHQDGIIPSEIFGEAAATIVALAEALEPFAKFMDGLEVLSGPSACRPGMDFYVLESSKVGRRAIGHDDFARARSALARLKGDSHAG